MRDKRPLAQIDQSRFPCRARRGRRQLDLKNPSWIHFKDYLEVKKFVLFFVLMLISRCCFGRVSWKRFQGVSGLGGRCDEAGCGCEQDVHAGTRSKILGPGKVF